MSTDLIVQNAVTAVILAAAVWFGFRQIRSFGRGPAELHAGDEVALVRTRRIESGAHLHWGRSDRASGGRLALGADRMTVKWGLGSKTEIEYTRVVALRIERFGAVDILVLELEGEDHYWALGVRRARMPALLAYLSAVGIDRAGPA